MEYRDAYDRDFRKIVGASPNERGRKSQNAEQRMMDMKEPRQSAAAGPLLILLAGVLWGSMGLFVRRLGAAGFSSLQITAGRLLFSAVSFWILLLFRPPEERSIRLRDLPLFLGLGLVSVLFFTVCYFSAIELMPLSTAAILLYTAPIWVTLLSALLFRDRLTLPGLLALAMAFGGCVLVSGVRGGGLTPRGLLLGLGAGLGYGLYSIFGSVALRRYSPYTVTAWGFLIAAAGACCICRPGEAIATLLAAPSPVGTALFFVFTALFTAVAPYLCYTLGLRTVRPGSAAIFATVEPVVASLLGVLVFHETLTPGALCGILLVLGAVVLLSLTKKE